MDGILVSKEPPGMPDTRAEDDALPAIITCTAAQQACIMSHYTLYMKHQKCERGLGLVDDD